MRVSLGVSTKTKREREKEFYWEFQPRERGREREREYDVLTVYVDGCSVSTVQPSCHQHTPFSTHMESIMRSTLLRERGAASARYTVWGKVGPPHKTFSTVT